MSDIRDCFKAYRKKLGLSQSEFGVIFGVKRNQVSQWETNHVRNYTPIGVEPGDKFGQLTVIRKTEEKKHGYYLWECRCDCGNIKLLNSSTLSKGGTKSCGCLKEGRTKPGSRVGKLTVVRDSGRRYRGGVIWECRCDCGNVTYMPTSTLLAPAKSCGCARLENIASMKDEILTKSKAARILTDGTALADLNRKINSNNKSGIKGVSFAKDKGKWHAKITFRRKVMHIGYYHTKEAAAAARREAELKYFAPVLHEHGMQLKPQEIDQDMMKDDTYRRRPFYDFKKGDK